MKRWEFVANDPGQTDQVAAAFARLASEGTVIGLIGTLGAGKTHFVRGLATALGVPADHVVSPTFVLCQQYDTVAHDRPAPTIFHYDAFRLADPHDFAALGSDEVLGRVGIALIEWSDRVESVLPRDRLEIHIEDCGDTVRRISIIALGPRSAELLEKVATSLGGPPNRRTSVQ